MTAASIAEVETVARSYRSSAQKVTALFAAVPLIVGDYIDGSAALALDWYDELRDAAEPEQVFTPSPVTLVRDAELGNAVAWATEELRTLESDALADLDVLTEEMLARLTPAVQKDVAAGFWDTMTENVREDPDADGWQRFARGASACPFCRMLADKGAVYRAESTATFAAHPSCHCVAAPAFKGHHGPEASAIQYVASSKRRSDKDRAALREYLKANYGA